MSEEGENFSLTPINAIEAVSRAEIDQQISTAKRYPRNLTKVKQEMVEMATLDEDTAASCFYSLPRGGKNIQGPSIRLAEIALSCYGNIRAGTRIIETVVDGHSPYVAIQAVCHDLEKNIAVMMEKRRRIVGKKTKGGIIDEDDINLAANAGSAIAFRDAMFKIIPGILLRPVYESAKKVAIGDAKTLSDRRVRAIEAFQKMGVPAERVLASIGHSKIDEVTLEDLETLIGTFTAIKEGSTTIENAFPPIVKEQRKVEKPEFDETKPNFGETKPAPVERAAVEPSTETDEVLAPEKRERKLRSDAGHPRGPRSIKSSGLPESPTEEPQEPEAERLFQEKAQARKGVTPQAIDALYAELHGEPTRGNFLEGLKQIGFPGVPADAELLSELDETTCQAILARGVTQLFEEIREHRWKKAIVQP